MIGNKKGVSMVVSTMIIILLVIVAVGIIWFVARGIFTGGGESFALGSKCLAVDLQATGSCVAAADGGNDGNCSVRIERRPGGEDIGGVKLVYETEAGDANFVHDKSGSINEFDIKNIDNIDTGLVNISKIEVVAYFTDESGNAQPCAGATATINL